MKKTVDENKEALEEAAKTPKKLGRFNKGNLNKAKFEGTAVAVEDAANTVTEAATDDINDFINSYLKNNK